MIRKENLETHPLDILLRRSVGSEKEWGETHWDIEYRTMTEDGWTHFATQIRCAHYQSLLDKMETVPTDRCPFCPSGCARYYEAPDHPSLSGWISRGSDMAMRYCSSCSAPLPVLREERWVVE